MAAPILFVRDIHLTFGGAPLLEGADLSILPGDKICLVGRNGSGKSTLLKIAAGMVEADRGERFVQPGVTMRYLPQEPDFGSHSTVEAYVLAGLTEGDDPHNATTLIGELGLTGEENPARLSGGEARRAVLARTLAPRPDILLLDEPTNHLDLQSIEWLEAILRQTRSAMVMISHDRRFLENLSRQTLWIDRGETKLLNKGFGQFEDWRDDLLEQEDIERHKLGRKIVREEHWITYGVSGRRKRNVKRLGDLGGLKDTQRNAKKVQGGVKMTLADAEASGKLVARIHGVSKSFGDREIVKDFSLLIQRGDRIGIVGPNGSGKSTLLNLITQNLEPDSGTVKHGVNLDLLVLDQKRETLAPDWTLKDALTDGAGDMVAIGEERKHVMSYMKDFLFTPDQVRTPLHALSGGERGRLTLARGLRHPSNFMVLDEPTNDLDLETLELLQEMLADYPGTVMIVSHDRDFLDRTCTSIIANDPKRDGDGVWTQYAGGYSDMVAQRDGRKTQAGLLEKSKSGTSKSNGIGKSGKSAAKSRIAKLGANSDNSGQTQKLTFKQQHALETLPKEIERLQFEIERLNQALAKPDLYTNDLKKFAKYSNELAAREERLATAEEEWLELEMLREEVEG